VPKLGKANAQPAGCGVVLFAASMIQERPLTAAKVIESKGDDECR
jgi:hypothetical protein